MGLKLHDYNKDLKRAINKLHNSTSISNNDKETILRFHDYCYSEGLSTARVVLYIHQLSKISHLLDKDFDKATRPDIERIIRVIEQTDFSEWTKKGYKVIIKKFYRWLRGSEEDPEETKWIKTTMKKGKNIMPEELLSEDNIKKLIEASENPRDKALVSVLYESGCRVGEVGTLQLKHVTFDEYGAILMVDGKTGRRRVRVIASTPLLSAWLNTHPCGDDPDAPVWVSIGTRAKNSLISYSAINSLLRKLAKRAGVRKRVNPHMFRHSRATHLASHLTEAQMKEYFGWTQGSDMAAVYVHMSGRDVDDALFQVYGIESGRKKEKVSSLKPVFCSRCHESNPVTGKFCVKCGIPLSLDTAMELDAKRQKWDIIMSELVEDPDVQKVLAKKIVELGLKKQMAQV